VCAGRLACEDSARSFKKWTSIKKIVDCQETWGAKGYLEIERGRFELGITRRSKMRGRSVDVTWMQVGVVSSVGCRVRKKCVVQVAGRGMTA